MKKHYNKSNYIHYKRADKTSFFDSSPTAPPNSKMIDFENNQDKEPIYILGERIYSSYRLKDCLPEYRMEIKENKLSNQFLGASFKMGQIVDDSISIQDIGPRKPNFSRARFTLRIPLSVRIGNTHSGEILEISGYLPELKKDLILFIPEARSEYNYRIVADTRCELMAPPVIDDTGIELPIGIYSIISVVGKIPLLVPTYAHVPEQPQAEEYKELKEVLCSEFNEKPFPKDFFPPKFVDLEL